MEKATETWVTAPDRLVSSTRRDACVVHIYPTGPGMGARYALTDTPMVIGRGNDCDIRINDHSVSRRHARIQPGADGYYAVDLQSTNGTFVNDVPASICKLKDGDYLRVGNCIYRFLAGGNVEAEYHEEIYRLTIIDALTDIHNKRYLLEFLDRELSRSARYGRPLALIMFDIDRFKSDQRGAGPPGRRLHAARDGGCVKGNIRKEELFARYGGEEFAVVLPETTLEGGIAVAERIRSQVEQQLFQYEGKAYPVTVSIGVATTTGEEPLTPQRTDSPGRRKTVPGQERGPQPRGGVTPEPSRHSQPRSARPPGRRRPLPPAQARASPVGVPSSGQFAAHGPGGVAQVQSLLQVGGQEGVAVVGQRRPGGTAPRRPSAAFRPVQRIAAKAVAETGQGDRGAVAADRQGADVGHRGRRATGRFRRCRNRRPGRNRRTPPAPGVRG